MKGDTMNKLNLTVWENWWILEQFSIIHFTEEQHSTDDIVKKTLKKCLQSVSQSENIYHFFLITHKRDYVMLTDINKNITIRWSN